MDTVEQRNALGSNLKQHFNTRVLIVGVRCRYGVADKTDAVEAMSSDRVRDAEKDRRMAAPCGDACGEGYLTSAAYGNCTTRPVLRRSISNAAPEHREMRVSAITPASASDAFPNTKPVTNSWGSEEGHDGNCEPAHAADTPRQPHARYPTRATRKERTRDSSRGTKARKSAAVTEATGPSLVSLWYRGCEAHAHMRAR